MQQNANPMVELAYPPNQKNKNLNNYNNAIRRAPLITQELFPNQGYKTKINMLIETNIRFVLG